MKKVIKFVFIVLLLAGAFFVGRVSEGSIFNGTFRINSDSVHSLIPSKDNTDTFDEDNTNTESNTTIIWDNDNSDIWDNDNSDIWDNDNSNTWDNDNSNTNTESNDIEDYSMKCVLTFNSEGGSEVEDMYVPINTTLTSLPEPSRDGCAFLGWYCDSLYNTERLDYSTIITEDTKLYAKWKHTDNISYSFDNYYTLIWTDGISLKMNFCINNCNIYRIEDCAIEIISHGASVAYDTFTISTSNYFRKGIWYTNFEFFFDLDHCDYDKIKSGLASDWYFIIYSSNASFIAKPEELLTIG